MKCSSGILYPFKKLDELFKRKGTNTAIVISVWVIVSLLSFMFVLIAYLLLSMMMIFTVPYFVYKSYKYHKNVRKAKKYAKKKILFEEIEKEMRK